MNIKINKYKFKYQDDLTFWKQIKTWEPESFKILDKFLEKDKCFIDIGAWNGVLSIYASILSKNVYSFEPNPIAFKKLENNIKLNKIQNIKCIQKCVNNKIGKTDFFIRSAGDSVSSLINRTGNYKTNKIIKVDSIKFSEYINKIKENIALIKIDTEGSEIYILKEMEKYMMKYKPKMYISFHPNWFPEKENEINYLSDMLFNIYDVFTINFKKITKIEFKEKLNNTEHSFIFKKC